MTPPVILTAAFRVLFPAAALWLGPPGIRGSGGAIASTPFDATPQVWHAQGMLYGSPSAAFAGWRGLRTPDRPVPWNLHLPRLMPGPGRFALGLASYGVFGEISAIEAEREEKT